MKKDRGFFDNIIAALPVAVAALLVVMIIQMEVYQAASTFIEDGLVASNLASAIIDIEEYGISHQLLIEDPAAACESFKKVLKSNLKLNEQLQCANSSIMDGQVTITEYSIYEVRGADVIQYYFPNGRPENVVRREYAGGVGNVSAPDGTIIYSTSIYSRIDFQENFFGTPINVFKQKCVDIVEN